MSLSVGDIVDGRYRIEGLLGEGGFATVYEASDIMSGRSVALKVLSAELLDSERTRARFEREVEVVASLQSPHTVKLFARGTTPHGAPYIVFEHVPGRDLREILLEVDHLAPDVVRHIVGQVLEALVEAHRAGVVHRDLKPDNIRLFEYGGDPWRAKVLDFGVALATGDANPRLTAANELVGTPRYMSPEQLLDNDPGPSSDIYALGIVAWEMLVGSEALHGPRWGDQLARLQSGFHLVAEQDFGELSDIIHKMVARDRSERFASAEEVLRALSAQPAARAETEREQAAPPPPAQTRRPDPPTEPTSRAAREGQYPRERSNRQLIVGIFIGLLLAGGVAIVMSLGDEPEATVVSPPTQVLEVPAVPPRPAVAPAVAKSPDTADMASVPDLGPVVGGCGRDPGWDGPRSFTTSVAPQRDWESTIYLPRGYDPNHEHPVVLLVQTTLAESDWLEKSTRIRSLADEHRFISISFDRLPMPWLPWTPAHIPFVFDELARASQIGCVDLDRVFVIGHGTGTDLTRRLACHGRFAALALVGDIQTEVPQCAIAPPVPVIRFAGEDDRYVPVRGGPNCLDTEVRSRAAIDANWRKTNACSETKTIWRKDARGTCFEHDDCAAPYVTCLVDGGHHFPDSPIVPIEMPKCGRNKPTHFPIMDAIWDFFESTADVE